MKNFEIHSRDESGFVLVTAMLLLVVLTVIGVAATQTSMFDIMLSSAEMKKQEAFYAAEGGLDHGSVLVLPIMRGNIDENADPPIPLTFLVDGSQSGLDSATGDDFDGGAVVLNNESIGDGYTYSVRIYNNRDGGGATEDKDGLVILGSRAQKANGGASQVEIGLKAIVKEFLEENYRAQEGAGGTKNYNANDSGVVDFSVKSGGGRERQYQLGAS